MNKLREIAYRLDPALWVRDVLGLEPAPWQEEFLRARRGVSLVALTARQVGKTTTASLAIGHHMIFYPNSLSVVACPAQRQSAEAVRRVRDIVLAAQQKLRTDNTYGLELENGSRVLALPGDDDSIRGLTVDGWIIIDEAARVSRKLVAAVRPMRARHPEARLAMMSTAWSRIDPFWTAWSSEDGGWTKLKVTVDMPDCPLPAQHVEQERANLSEEEFKREYLGIPAGSHTSPFTWELYDQATQIFTPTAPPGRAFQPASEVVVRAANPFKNINI
jgi:Terminase large subunit, T4likevirus-type, N-terminal